MWYGPLLEKRKIITIVYMTIWIEVLNETCKFTRDVINHIKWKDNIEGKVVFDTSEVGSSGKLLITIRGELKLKRYLKIE